MKNNNPRDKYIEYLKKNSISDENIKKILIIEDKKAKDGLFCYDTEFASLLYAVEFGTVEIN